MKILVISGSRRTPAYSRVLAGPAFDYALEKYGNAELLDLAVAPLENFRGFEAEHGEETRAIIRQVSEADVFIICSSIYNGLLSSGIKNLFEFVDYKAL